MIGPVARQRISSGSSFEKTIRFSPAIRSGLQVLVSGTEWGDVVRTPVYVTALGDSEQMGTVYGEIFAHVRPTATVGIAARIGDSNPEWNLVDQLHRLTLVALQHFMFPSFDQARVDLNIQTS
ncbi:hypothetical protein [Tomitella biformata]|uniref:hypothetical protein n=1 Tax=Tomitella biformata TaxID=630403 RepID=UPI000467AD39|nr:hypothetical protein [Tomitella biformata]